MTVIGDLLVEFNEKPSGEEPPVLTLTEKNGFVKQSDRFKKRLATDNTDKYKVVRKNDIAFNPYLLWAGAVAQNTIIDKGIISPLYPTFRVRDGYHARYVGRLLLMPQIVKLYDGISFGSVPRRRRSSVSNFLALPIPKVPPLIQQQRIAEVLDRVDALKAKRRQAMAYLDELAQSIFIAMFGNTVTNNFQWPENRQLGNVANVTAGITKGRRLPPLAKVVSTPYLAVANVQHMRLDLSVVKKLDVTHSEIERYRLQRNDLLLTEGGDPDKLGRGTLWREEIPLCLHQNHIFRVRVLENARTDPVFLNWLVASERGRRYFLRSAKQTTGIASINAAQLRAFPLLDPPVELQRKFAGQIRSVEAMKRSHERHLIDLDALFATVQYRAFRGELFEGSSTA